MSDAIWSKTQTLERLVELRETLRNEESRLLVRDPSIHKDNFDIDFQTNGRAKVLLNTFRSNLLTLIREEIQRITKEIGEGV